MCTRKEAEMHDPFVGTWKLNPARSQFDPNHRPADATMRWQIEPDGGYLLLAEGLDERGQPCTEKPQKLVPDGNAYPVENLPGLTCVTSRLGTRTLRADVKRDDGSIAGEGSYTVSEDGASMTAATAGFDSQLRRFEMRTVWDRV
jgi:hypothetical protein